METQDTILLNSPIRKIRKSMKTIANKKKLLVISIKLFGIKGKQILFVYGRGLAEAREAISALFDDAGKNEDVATSEVLSSRTGKSKRAYIRKKSRNRKNAEAQNSN